MARALAPTYERLEGTVASHAGLIARITLDAVWCRYWWNGILLSERIVLAHKTTYC